MVEPRIFHQWQASAILPVQANGALHRISRRYQRPFPAVNSMVSLRHAP